ncbi:Ceramide glucosyltransferase [Emydomyces testavorans]|uniref:Ceramide glucosyltransferase n=1 Tax=Emydomyces testavorans TaxID=2070801 RepID=A0AAF0IFK5_9EURO|nr:Ceramide glucosyltransferase [Emydomyces testavorans]
MLAESASLQVNTAGFTCSNGRPLWLVAAGWVAIAWQRHFSKLPRKAVVTTALPHSEVPHVTIIRPVKGLEPFLYDCLAASIRQDYPRDKLTVYFCVSSTQDPAYPILKRILRDFPDADARVFVEPAYKDSELGPNPKIRNMSQAYWEAKGDIVWIMDCNIWLGKGACGRMVDRLCGFDKKKNGGRKFKFVHHLPIVVDVLDHGISQEPGSLAYSHHGATETIPNDRERRSSTIASMLSHGGGRLEELFLASSHAKLYSAINTVLVTPCIIGKSSMFRRSHLNYLTTKPPGDPRRVKRRPGIDYFSDNICEDHLIGERLWRGKVFEEAEQNEKWGKHHLVLGDMAIQPMSGMSVGSYIERRVRWLRVRKFTVLLATFVEPGTESFLCSAYLAFGLTTSVPFHFPEYCSYLASWSACFSIWAISILVWMVIDWTVYLTLHSGATVEVDEFTPPFARPLPKTSFARRPFREWLCAWLVREALTWPIWFWSFYGGTTVKWRDKVFKVGMDMVTYEVGQLAGQVKKIHVKSQSAGQQVHDHYLDGGSSIRRRTPTGSFVNPAMVTARVTEAGIEKS